MKRFLSLMLIFTLLCPCLFAYALAETRASNYFSSYGTSMSAPGGGGINITFRAVGTDICNQIGVANYCVQKLNDDGNWEYCSGTLSGQTGTNVASYTFGRYFQGVAGETYRIQVTFLCTINNGTETKSYTSGRITAK
ncbi:MAG: hypothetical protein IJO39_06375 [Clostridia bacterium]|nr:hypothetical protein [Clostridia bacterium]